MCQRFAFFQSSPTPGSCRTTRRFAGLSQLLSGRAVAPRLPTSPGRHWRPAGERKTPLFPAQNNCSRHMQCCRRPRVGAKPPAPRRRPAGNYLTIVSPAAKFADRGCRFVRCVLPTCYVIRFTTDHRLPRPVTRVFSGKFSHVKPFAKTTYNFATPFPPETWATYFHNPFTINHLNRPHPPNILAPNHPLPPAFSPSSTGSHGVSKLPARITKSLAPDGWIPRPNRSVSDLYTRTSIPDRLAQFQAIFPRNPPLRPGQIFPPQVGRPDGRLHPDYYRSRVSGAMWYRRQQDQSPQGMERH